jgi:hypothetical protein
MTGNLDKMRENRLKATEHNHTQYEGVVANEKSLTKQACYMTRRSFGPDYLGNLKLAKAAGTSFSRYGTIRPTSGLFLVASDTDRTAHVAFAQKAKRMLI